MSQKKASRKKTISRIAAIDIGSNGIRMSVARVRKPHDFDVIKTYRASIRLGADVFSTKRIHPETLAQMVNAFTEFQKIAQQYKVNAIRAVATSAMREATNAASCIKHLEETTGLAIETISGIEEAKLIHLAVSHAVHLRGKKTLLMDIGGGSVELSVSRNDSLEKTKSFPLGTVRLLSEFNNSEESPSYFTMMRSLLKREPTIESYLKNQVHADGIDQFIGTGGNIEALGKLRKKILYSTNAHEVSCSELDALLLTLMSLSPKERVKQLKLKPYRADVILPAALLLRTVFEHIRPQKILIPFVGLKEGLLHKISTTV